MASTDRSQYILTSNNAPSIQDLHNIIYDIQKITTGGSGDIKSDGSVNFSREELFEEGLKTDTINGFTSPSDINILKFNSNLVGIGDVDDNGDSTKVTVNDSTQTVNILGVLIKTNLSAYLNDSDAIANGLTQGCLYYLAATGSVQIVQ